ncbi:hypothetical protein EBZ39_14340, partial [bacterium]|nr:hypothetical protein [bacterium]
MIPGFTYSTNPGGPGAIISQGPIQTGPGGFLPGDTNSYNAGLGQSKAAYYGSLFPSLASFGRNFADAYGSMAGGASNVAQAMANESVGRMGALGMAEAARQT